MYYASAADYEAEKLSGGGDPAQLLRNTLSDFSSAQSLTTWLTFGDSLLIVVSVSDRLGAVTNVSAQISVAMSSAN